MTTNNIFLYTEDGYIGHKYIILDPDAFCTGEDLEAFGNSDAIVDHVDADEYLTLEDEENGLVSWIAKYEVENGCELVDYNDWNTDPDDMIDWDSEWKFREGR